MRWKLFLIMVCNPVYWWENVVINGIIAAARFSICHVRRSPVCGGAVDEAAPVAGRRDASVLLLIVRRKRLEHPLRLKLVNKIDMALLRSVEHEAIR